MGEDRLCEEGAMKSYRVWFGFWRGCVRFGGWCGEGREFGFNEMEDFEDEFGWFGGFDTVCFNNGVGETSRINTVCSTAVDESFEDCDTISFCRC